MKRLLFIFILLSFVALCGFNTLYAQKAEKKQSEQKKIEQEKLIKEQNKLIQRRIEKQTLENIMQALQKVRQEEITLRRELENLKFKTKIEFTPEFEEKVMFRLQQQDAARAHEIELLKSTEKNKYRQALEDYYIATDRMDKLKEKDPIRYEQLQKKRELEHKSHSFIEEYRATSVQKEKNKLRDELRSVLNELFDLRELDRQQEIKKLTAKIDDLKKVMNERKKRKKDIVERRLKQLLGEERELVW